MRLLKTKSLQLEDFFSDEVPSYAILSHRWGKEEVSFQDIQASNQKRRHGYAKLKAFCDKAASDGLEYAWCDTCCINKESSAELQESINSMFSWYQNAQKCYAYLHDVEGADLYDARVELQVVVSEWFHRGWTLQELIAPSKVAFYDQSWKLIGHKSDMRELLSTITYIDRDVLAGTKTLSQCTISQRMGWASKRKTTRIEDRAYSLLGIFNVYMPMLYGEKERAFRRLQEEIIKQSDDHSLFVWKSETYTKSVMAPSPSCFERVIDLMRLVPNNDTSQGYTLVNAGLLIQLDLIPWAMNTYLAPLHCGGIATNSSLTGRTSFRGYDRVCIFLQRTTHENQFVRVAMDLKDYDILNGDNVADMRNRYGFRNRQILIRQFNDTSYDEPIQPSFYGFSFEFLHPRMFIGSEVPQPKDALTYGHSRASRGRPWTGRKHGSLFEISEGQHHMAGMFRLTGFPGLHMYLGFDVDFSPLCLITTRSPRSQLYGLLPTDFSKLSDFEVQELLDITWLRSQISQEDNQGETVLKLKVDRHSGASVDCRNLDMRISFEFKHSNRLDMKAWEVRFTALSPLPDSETGTPSPPRSPRVTVPSVVVTETKLESPGRTTLESLPTLPSTDPICESVSKDGNILIRTNPRSSHNFLPVIRNQDPSQRAINVEYVKETVRQRPRSMGNWRVSNVDLPGVTEQRPRRRSDNGDPFGPSKTIYQVLPRKQDDPRRATFFG